AIEDLFANPPASYGPEQTALFARFKQLLNTGEVRAAEPDASIPVGWRVNPWVKQGILLGFRMGTLVDMSIETGRQPWFDRSSYPVKQLRVEDGVRVVPGGSSIRDGSFVARTVTCMPPMYINVGAYVGAGTMVDSHALVGSCAQVGERCHVSAAAQIGGVLEPVGAMPVIIEDDVMVGGNCGVYEGTVVKRRAVLATGVLLNQSTPVFDLVRGEVLRASDGQPLVIPEDAVVVPGSRAITQGVGKDWGLSVSAAIIVKYRDAKTEGKVQLEDLLR
ncbi:MAG: 2,3,4,5-tetrahydropyridine-2,6-dicarboxylate N-succinyltransferase, partial [Bryobacterales bacterium]|nr:2,3,4,5-tetrahydropyridine-2,6-dicarboxylate N-succinyltransferase [Bryobacterales bacterium]